MNLQAASPVIKELVHEVKKENRNTTCLYSGCSNMPTGSHVIARKTLKLIADNGKLLTWKSPDASFWDMARTMERGESLEQLNAEPISIGIEEINKVKFPLFCHDHDERIFASIEKRDFSFEPEQVVILAYRALCYLAFRKDPTKAILAVANKHGYHHSLDTPERLAKLKRFHARDTMSAARLCMSEYNVTKTMIGWGGQCIW